MKFSILIFSFLFLSGFAYHINDKCNDQPQINKQIIDFIKPKIKKKVGRGECWDLAAEALTAVGAKWDHDLKFGKKINLKAGECVYPGDIIQFEGVEVDYRIGNTIYHEDLAHHTAIIYEVKDKTNFILAQQNTAEHGKKVSLDPLDLKNISKGSFTIFRPEK